MEYLQYTTANKKAVLASKTCACVFCKSEYPARRVKEYIDDTAVCPECGIDAVIPSSLVSRDQLKVKIDEWHNAGFS